MADKNGRLWDRPERIKAECLPYDDCEIENMLADLAKSDFILRYESGERNCIQVINFEKHQSLTSWEKSTSAEVPAPKHFRSTSKALQKSVRSASKELQHNTVQNSNDSTEQKGTEQTPFHGEEFLAALVDYEQHRKEKRDALKPTSRRLLYRKFELWGERASTASMLESIQNGWTGVFPPRENGNGRGVSKADQSIAAGERLIAKHERESRIRSAGANDSGNGSGIPRSSD